MTLALAISCGSALTPVLDRRFQIQKKVQLVSTVCKYWSLKRQSRRGAPLLRRLHIQSHMPRSTSLSELTPVQLKEKRARLFELRDNLERARAIVDSISKREALKVKSETV